MKDHTKEDIKNKNECTGKNHPKNVKLNSVKFFKQEFSDEMFCDNRIGSNDVYLSPESAAKLLDVSRKFIYELIQSKQLEAINLGRKIKRIKKRTLEEWLTNQAMKHER